MGQVGHPPAVLFLVAAFSGDGAALDWARDWLAETWGPIALESDRFDFTETDYYEASMGADLKKTFFAFRQLMDPAHLPARKRAANEAELAFAKQHAVGVARPLNLDPGYITQSKLVLASTKNHAHRIYLAEGIFAEITLRYQAGCWQPWPWTYPDYRRADFQRFFDDCRDYHRQCDRALD